ncbi:hypothetical protein GUITHDRAFT_111717 [Guillardia theta CCMP2712]|uniref:Uncharacterized protein n=1 Tax=Guillardia theta (strain CCMP2712) TaxID=905079 RepID=L1J230_GUITC|nr:hypothetical protein GUITHDRAFT_111717 [Guillardia theta CCMP2712]EKX42150.1 hypothetical protein GUITHDRAFT_111717 [Guillardia theta CCMP2712]|eukprot:XP_005829130.1 hypothetical protein GUITHDRAFT_111717 [Guillardia theta CCMP2712]
MVGESTKIEGSSQGVQAGTDADADAWSQSSNQLVATPHRGSDKPQACQPAISIRDLPEDDAVMEGVCGRAGPNEGGGRPHTVVGTRSMRREDLVTLAGEHMGAAKVPEGSATSQSTDGTHSRRACVLELVGESTKIEGSSQGVQAGTDADADAWSQSSNQLVATPHRGSDKPQACQPAISIRDLPEDDAVMEGVCGRAGPNEGGGRPHTVVGTRSMRREDLVTLAGEHMGAAKVPEGSATSQSTDGTHSRRACAQFMEGCCISWAAWKSFKGLFPKIVGFESFVRSISEMV